MICFSFFLIPGIFSILSIDAVRPHIPESLAEVEDENSQEKPEDNNALETLTAALGNAIEVSSDIPCHMDVQVAHQFSIRPENPQILFHSLKNMVSYFQDHEKDIDVNLLFGFAIVIGQLKNIQDLIPAESIWHSTLQKLICDLNRLKDDAILCLDGPTFDYVFKLLTILSPTTWAFYEPPKRLRFAESPATITIDNNSVSGVLNRNWSDYCLHRVSNGCNIPTDCILMELDSNSSGYSLTHQILFLILAKQNRCELQLHAEVVDLKQVIEAKCKKVFLEASELYRRPIYRESTACDLFIEQIAVCGLQNFMEFFENKNWLGFVQSLQSPYGYFKCHTEGTQLSRQLSIATMNHVSSVSAVAITLNLKDALLNTLTLSSD